MLNAENLKNQFPSLKKWQPSRWDNIQLYTLATPNGVKVSIALEELGLNYDAHKIDISNNEQFFPEFLSIAPNNKIPAILDLNGPEGQPLALFESGAILLYLAEKTGQLLPSQAALRHQAVQWIMWQMGGLGPMFGQLGFFHKFAGAQWEDKRPRDRYAAEARRILGVLDKHLEGKNWMMGQNYSMVDIAIFPWVRTLRDFYQAGDLVGLDNFKNVLRALDTFLQRPAVQRGLIVPEAR